MRKISICSSGASWIERSMSSSTSSAPSLVRISTYRVSAASNGAVPPAAESARIAYRASCCASSAATFRRGRTSSSGAPASSIDACVDTAKRYCASPSWMSPATRARSSATARPNSAKRIARHAPTSISPYASMRRKSPYDTYELASSGWKTQCSDAKSMSVNPSASQLARSSPRRRNRSLQPTTETR